MALREQSDSAYEQRLLRFEQVFRGDYSRTKNKSFSRGSTAVLRPGEVEDHSAMLSEARATLLGGEPVDAEQILWRFKTVLMEYLEIHKDRFTSGEAPEVEATRSRKFVHFICWR